jgi:hypothetical protein
MLVAYVHTMHKHMVRYLQSSQFWSSYIQEIKVKTEQTIPAECEGGATTLPLIHAWWVQLTTGNKCE